MIKFTKEEINLCKQVAERYRKEISKGGWFLLPGENFAKDAKELFARKGIQFIEIGKIGYTVDLWTQQYSLTANRQLTDFGYVPTPLWTISDCLEFLESNGWEVLGITWQEVAIKIINYVANMSDSGKGDYAVVMQNPSKRTTRIFKGNTRLCACLKAVLAVLVESNG